MSKSNSFLFEKETYNIIGALMEVHKQLGCGFLEAVYKEALAIEFQLRHIPYEAEKTLGILYKDIPLKKTYNADFVCYEKIIVEAKALSVLTSDHESQTINYLKCTGHEVAILANFGERSLKYKRFILTI